MTCAQCGRETNGMTEHRVDAAADMTWLLGVAKHPVDQLRFHPEHCPGSCDTPGEHA